MKYYNTIIAVLCVVLGIAACTKQETQVENEPVQEIEEPQPSEPQIETMPLSLDASGEAATKTTLSGTTVSWKSSDEISVFDGTLPNQRFTTTDSGTSVTFEGEVSTGATEYYALYPYTSTASLTAGKKITGITLPATQTALAGTFADNLNITVASGSVSDGAASFKNVCSVVRFTLNEPYVTKVTFKGNNNETIAGDLTIDYNSGNPTVEVANPQKEVSIGDGSSVLATGVEYCMVILPADFTEGITLAFQYESGKHYGTRHKTSFIASDLDRNNIMELGTVTANCIILYDDAWLSSSSDVTVSATGVGKDDVLDYACTESPYHGQKCIKWKINSSTQNICLNFSNYIDLSDYEAAGYSLEFKVKCSDWINGNVFYAMMKDSSYGGWTPWLYSQNAIHKFDKAKTGNNSLDPDQWWPISISLDQLWGQTKDFTDGGATVTWDATTHPHTDSSSSRWLPDMNKLGVIGFWGKASAEYTLWFDDIRICAPSFTPAS